MEPLLLIIIAVLLLVCLISYITTLNKLRRLNIKVDEALSGIDVALAKRYDALTKMVDVVKGYTKYEQETLFEIVKLRSNMSINEMNEACNNMFNFMRKNKLSKKLNTVIAETIISIFRINELYDKKPLYVQNCENGTYEGEMEKGKREGKGKFFFLNGDIYEGDFKNNLRHGKGKYTYCNKDVYEGDFNNGEIDGKGKYSYVEGDIYDGEYKHEKREGQGTYIYSNKDKYVGQWKGGKKKKIMKSLKK